MGATSQTPEDPGGIFSSDECPTIPLFLQRIPGYPNTRDGLFHLHSPVFLETQTVLPSQSLTLCFYQQSGSGQNKQTQRAGTEQGPAGSVGGTGRIQLLGGFWGESGDGTPWHPGWPRMNSAMSLSPAALSALALWQPSPAELRNPPKNGRKK